MAFVQGASGGSAANANVATFALAFTAAVSLGNAILVDVVWRSPAGGSGSLSLTDSLGNPYLTVFSVQDGSTGVWMGQYISLSTPGGSETITAHYIPTSGAAYFADIAMAIHEYANVARIGLGVSASQGVWTAHAPLNAAGTASITVASSTNDSFILHAFGACIGTAWIQAPDWFEGNPGWVPRETTRGSGVGNSIVSFDQPLSQAGGLLSFSDIIEGIGAPDIATGITALYTPISPSSPGSAWLIINEPGTLNPTPGFTDRSALLHFGNGSKHTLTNTLQQRGTATIPLWLKAGFTYDATQLEGCQVFLYDQPPSGAVLVWAGTVEKVKIDARGLKGDRIATLACTSLRQCFDTLEVPPQTFQGQTAGAIFTSLFNSVATGVPLSLGTVNSLYIVNILSLSWDRLSTVFDTLAKEANCIWDIDLPTLSVYFQPPTATAAPYSIAPKQLLYGSVVYELNRQDYRNRQIIRISEDAFAQSSETFPFSGVPASFILKAGAKSVTGAWLTNSTRNFASGSFSGIPANGDTVAVSYPQTGSIYNWAPNAPYSVGQAIIDPANHVQVVKVAGTSGGSPPSWNDTGGTTSDGPGSPVQPGFSGGVVWQDEGISGAGGFGASIYTFVTVLDNTQWGQVLIGPTVAACCQNLADAINATPLVNGVGSRGQTYSWPTWENPLLNAQALGSTLQVQNKPPGALYVAGLGAASSAFSWSAGQTAGGGTADTYDLQIAQNGSSNTANLYYTPGSNVVAIASNPTTHSVSWLVVQYQRQDGDCIVAENTAEVLKRAAIENGTGKYQQIVEDTSITSNTQGLQYVQGVLAAYDQIPITWSFNAFPPGLLPGQLLGVSISIPAFLAALLNGNWFVQEVTADLIPLKNGVPWVDQTTCPGGGHYRWTITVINESQIESWLGFWQKLATGGGGGGTSLIAGSNVQPSSSSSGVVTGTISLAGVSY